jgi:ADP-heptose:LPS heptosyltransferase
MQAHNRQSNRPGLHGTEPRERVVAHERLLLLTTNHVGNNLFCTTGIRLLKKYLPDMELDVVAMSFRGARVFDNNPDVRRVYRAASKLWVRWLAEKYDLVIGLHHDISRRYLGGTPKNGVIIGPASPSAHRAERILQFVQSLIGCPLADADRSYVLCPRPGDFTTIDRHLRHVGRDDILVGLHLGSGRTAVHGWKFWDSQRDRDPRIWPLEHYTALATMLRAASPRVRLVLTGSRNERFLGKRFTKRMSQVINLVGETSLLELAALMARLRRFVTHDTGALHVACATGVPLVGLFGPTEPTQTGPYPHRPQDILLRKTKIGEIDPAEVCAAILAGLAA